MPETTRTESPRPVDDLTAPSEDLLVEPPDYDVWLARSHAPGDPPPPHSRPPAQPHAPRSAPARPSPPAPGAAAADRRAGRAARPPPAAGAAEADGPAHDDDPARPRLGLRQVLDHERLLECAHDRGT